MMKLDRTETSLQSVASVNVILADLESISCEHDEQCACEGFSFYSLSRDGLDDVSFHGKLVKNYHNGHSDVLAVYVTCDGRYVFTKYYEEENEFCAYGDEYMGGSLHGAKISDSLNDAVLYFGYSNDAKMFYSELGINANFVIGSSEVEANGLCDGLGFGLHQAIRDDASDIEFCGKLIKRRYIDGYVLSVFKTRNGGYVFSSYKEGISTAWHEMGESVQSDYQAAVSDSLCGATTFFGFQSDEDMLGLMFGVVV